MSEISDIIFISIMPASLVYNYAGVGVAFQAEVAALGLSFANSAVLAVTVVGAIGFSTSYLLLRQSMEDCKAQDQKNLEKKILNELRETYGLKSSGGASLKFE